MKKIALVVGHTFDTPGYFSNILEESEYFYWSEFCDDYTENGNIFKHDIGIDSYTERQRLMATYTHDYDLVMELHFNAAESTQANGVEAYHYFSNKKTRTIANLYCKLVSESMGIKFRGAKPLYNKHQNGFGFVSQTKGNAILLEPFFASNYNDCDKFNRAAYEEVLKQVIIYFNESN